MDRHDAKILVITDTFPQAQGDDADLYILQILRALLEIGCEPTLIVRDGKGQEHAAALAQLGIKTYSGDQERLPALGREASAAEWSFARILGGNDFSLAILAQNFRRGISIPEHYLEEIRRRSRQTRIAILADQLYGSCASQRARITQRLEHHEVAEDHSEREWEAFRRADFVLIGNDADAEALLKEAGIGAAVVPLACEFAVRDRATPAGKSFLLAADFKLASDSDGFIWFLQQVWPILRKQAPDIEFLVCGAESIPAESRQKLPEIAWFPTAELDKAAQAAMLFVAPLRFGFSRNGILRMLAAGLPGVASNFVAGFDGRGIQNAATAEVFAYTVQQLCDDRQLWKAQSAQAQSFVRSKASWESLIAGLSEGLSQAFQGEPKAALNAPFSMTILDSLGDAQRRTAPPDRRISLRLDGHVHLAQEFLRSGNPRSARRQLRHVFSWLGESIQPSAPLARVIASLGRCYRELGDDVMVEVSSRAARNCFTVQNRTLNPPAVTARKHEPRISLIVPTYNRLPILKKCLAALEAQTAPPRLFEVIVIDDGSSDGTEEFMAQYQPQVALRSLRQSNSGTGAARKHGVQHARGEYLLLMNDDTIADPDLIKQHLAMQQKYVGERWAILGNFEYPPEARRRALTHFLRSSTFMFPQLEMENGFPYPYSHFITCNLSIRRDAVVEAGSFDSTYKLSEDTELGIRLYEMGYGVLYHSQAHAWHDHLPYTVQQLIRRARVYGADYFHMFRRHPRVTREWAMPVDLSGSSTETARQIAGYVEKNRRDVEAAVAALERWDSVDFEPILTIPPEAAQIMSLFQQAVPAIHWFYLLETMLATMNSAGRANAGNRVAVSAI